MPDDTIDNALYICYFGLRQPLVQTQVLPYLQEISKAGTRVSLITFEPNLRKTWTGPQLAEAKKDLEEKGILWNCLPYHKRPSAIATAYDIFRAVLHIRRRIKSENIGILHGRVHVATLMGALARKLSSRKPKLIFDIRGFFPEEYTDAGVWPEDGLLYKAAKRVERWLMQEADGFVVLTEKARQMLFPQAADPSTDGNGRPVEIIPCCVDFRIRFGPGAKDDRESIKTELNIKDRFVFVHLGALGGLYLTRDIVEFLASARYSDPRVFAMFLTQTDPAQVVSLLQDHSFTEKDYFVRMVDPAQVPSYLAAADAGLSFVKATYATQSRSPTKIPEYLAAGLPIIANSGVGDVDELISTEGVGVLLESFDRESYINSISQLRSLGDVSDKCRDTARRRFDLESVGGERYRRLYKKLLQS